MIEILTALLVLITGFYAWVTHRILKANEAAVEVVREQSEAISRPYVYATLNLLSDSPIYVLTIKNHGKTAAENLRIRIDRDFYLFQGQKDAKNIRDLFAFRKIIKSFPPDAELNFWLGTTLDIHGKNKKILNDVEGFEISMTYECSGRTIKECTFLDFRPFLSSSLPRHHVAKELQNIGKILKTISEKKN